MARPRGRRKTWARFIGLHHWMLRSPAWKTLAPNAKALLLHVWERHNGMNNGTISYAVREAEEIGLSKDAAARAFEILIDRGFLVVTRQSAFSVKTRAARLWRLTAEPCGDERATKNFMTWTGSAEGRTGETVKSKKQSLGRDAQSHERDRSGENERKLPLTVSTARLWDGQMTSQQSHQRDTSNIPGGSGNAERARRPTS